MSAAFKFTNADSSDLTSLQMQTLRSTLLETGQVVLNIYNSLATGTPGVYLAAATDLGEVNYPPKNSPYSDYNDILHWGSNSDNEYGLSVIYKNANNVDEEKLFTFSQGSKVLNKILLPKMFNLAIGSITPITLKYVVNPNINARRLYIGVDIDDS